MLDVIIDGDGYLDGSNWDQCHLPMAHNPPASQSMIRAAIFVLTGAICSYFALNRLTLNHTEESEPASKTDPMVALTQFYTHDLPSSINVEQVEETWELASQQVVGRGASMLVQVIKQKIYVDRSRWSSDYAWDQLRALFILEQLRIILKSRSFPDFEFILVKHCHLMSNSLIEHA